MPARLNDGAAAPGPAAPEPAHKDEAPELGGIGRIEEQRKADAVDSADAGAVEQARELTREVGADKLRASLAARLSLLGFGLYELAGGAFLVVAAHAAAHSCPDLRAVAAFLRQIGGAR